MEPSPETTTNLIPQGELSPTLQNQTLGSVPTLPPGLNPNPVASLHNDVDHHHLPPPTTPSLPPLHHSEPEETPIPSISIPQPSTASTAGFTKLINTIRRAPSISLGHVSNGGWSTVEKSPRPSLTIPPSGESVQEELPPLPPLPSRNLNHSNSPMNVAPMPNVQDTDPKKEKEKDKTKSTTGGWFKRKSIRVVADKSRSESGVSDSHPSPAIKGDKRHRHTPSTSNNASPIPIWSSPNSTLTDVVGHRPDHSRSESDHRNNKINGYFRKTPQEPASTFAGSAYFIDTPSTSTRSSHTHSGSSDVGSGAQLDAPPLRKPSLTGDRYRYPVDRKKSIDSNPVSPSSPSGRPMTAPSSPNSRTLDFNTRSLPPLPLPPPKTNSHRPNLSLNSSHSFYTEPQNTVNGKTNYPDMDNSSVNVNSRGIPISVPPASIAASAGQNSSVGSTNSATLNIKHKLSLGFKKRDKKDREREKVSPSTFNRF